MKTIEQRIIETQDQIIEKVKDWAQAFCKSDTEGLQETEYIISKLESELSDLKALAELQKETIVPYIKSEYDIQREKMKKLFGKYPDVFEQGVNALICAVEDFKALAEQQKQVSAEEIRVKIRLILVDYHRRDDYPLDKAEDDMLRLIASLSLRLPSEEKIMEAANEIFPELGGIKNENIAAFEIGVNWLKSYIKG